MYLDRVFMRMRYTKQNVYFGPFANNNFSGGASSVVETRPEHRFNFASFVGK